MGNLSAGVVVFISASISKLFIYIYLYILGFFFIQLVKSVKYERKRKLLKAFSAMN